MGEKWERSPGKSGKLSTSDAAVVYKEKLAESMQAVPSASGGGLGQLSADLQVEKGVGHGVGHGARVHWTPLASLHSSSLHLTVKTFRA